MNIVVIRHAVHRHHDRRLSGPDLYLTELAICHQHEVAKAYQRKVWASPGEHSLSLVEANTPYLIMRLSTYGGTLSLHQAIPSFLPPDPSEKRVAVLPLSTLPPLPGLYKPRIIKFSSIYKPTD